MGAFSILVGLLAGLAGPAMIVVVFIRSYSEERKRLATGGEISYQKTLLPRHPEEDENLVDLSARVKELGLGD